jgi:hypothetical protein
MIAGAQKEQVQHVYAKLPILPPKLMKKKKDITIIG